MFGCVGCIPLIVFVYACHGINCHGMESLREKKVGEGVKRGLMEVFMLSIADVCNGSVYGVLCC